MDSENMTWFLSSLSPCDAIKLFLLLLDGIPVRCCPFEVKLAILDSPFKGASQASIANEHGVGKSIISHLKKNECKLREFTITMENQGVSNGKKILHLAKENKMKKPLPMASSKTVMAL